MTHAKTGSWLWVQEPKGRWMQILKGPSIQSSFTDEDLLDCHIIACQGLLSPDLLPTVRFLLPSGQQMTQLQNSSLKVYYLGPNLVPDDLDWILQKQNLRHVEVIYQKIFLGKTGKEVGTCDQEGRGVRRRVCYQAKLTTGPASQGTSENSIGHRPKCPIRDKRVGILSCHSQSMSRSIPEVT